MGKGVEIRVITPGPAAEVPWYKKYAPHLAIGGAITAVITYFSLKKPRKK